MEELRDHKLTFGEIIGVKGNTVTGYETGLSVDKTIDALCSKIQKKLDEGCNSVEIAEMTKALAELITASAHIRIQKL